MKKSIKYAIFAILTVANMLFFAACSANKTGSNDGIKSISTKNLKKNVEKKDWVIVDTRLNDAFNGWKLDGLKRGGHIKGAVDFSSNWLKVDDKEKDKKLQKVLKAKGITSDKNVVLYDTNGKDAKEVADYLVKNGIKNIYTYNFKEWAEDESLRVESYANYQIIVPASWVNDIVKGSKPENYNGTSYKIFETSWGDEAKEYKAGHIPGAVHINTDEVEEGPVWNRLSDDRLEKFALNNGITIDTTVILYGDDPMPAYRVAAILKYMGVKDVRVLNGGYAAWKTAGYEQETKVNSKAPVSAFGAKVPVNKGYIVDMPGAKEILADKNGSRLVDIRSWDEHIGKTSGYDYIKEKGRPVGAVWGHAGSDNSNLQDFRNIDLTMKNGYEMLSMWKEWGITPDQKLSFFCGTGWRAAEVLIYADVMGLKNISLYDGGWNEWSMDKSNPVEVGEPAKK